MAYLLTNMSFLPSLLRWPIAGTTALLGIGLAFFPVQGQPLDRWLGAFIKSIYAPTQFVWQKDNAPPEIIVSPQVTTTQTSPPPQKAAVPAPAPIPKTATSPLPVSPVVQNTAPSIPTIPPAPPKMMAPTPPKPVTPAPPPLQVQKTATSGPVPFVPSPQKPPPVQSAQWTISSKPSETIKPLFSTQPVASQKQVVFSAPVSATNTKAAASGQSQFQQRNQTLTDQVALLQKELAQGQMTKNRLLEVQQTVASLIAEKDRLSSELVKLKQQQTMKNPQIPTTPTQYAQAKEVPQTTVKMVTPQTAVKSGIPRLTSNPNVITGIIKDSQGTLLPNMIITVKDKDGMPVRALKSNKLGQFAASTSLPNGLYVIEVEDPTNKFEFGSIQINLNGQVLPALEISAVSARDVMRAKLTQEIFGKNKI